jgi:hypothetical protein
MTTEAIRLIKWESESTDGILISMRMARRVSPERLRALRDALDVLGEQCQDWVSIDRELASALHALSFHLEGCAATLRADGKLPVELEMELSLIYESIDVAFGT